ncbi:hypothetical protein [Azospirillum sp. ST 5-10]
MPRRAVPRHGVLSYRSRRHTTGRAAMDIALMLLFVLFFFWQTITD